MKWLIAVLACVAMGAGCGLIGDDGFTVSDWDEFHQWCVEHRVRAHSDCGAIADWIDDYVNERGWDEDCFVRMTKRGLTAPTQNAIDIADAARGDCPRDG